MAGRGRAQHSENVYAHTRDECEEKLLKALIVKEMTLLSAAF